MSLIAQIVVLGCVLGASAILGSFAFALALVAQYMTDSTAHVAHFSDLQAIAYVTFVAALVAIPAALSIGLPAFFLLRRIGLLTWWSVCIVGALSGLLVGKAGVASELSYVAAAALGLLTALLASLLSLRTSLPFNGEQRLKTRNREASTNAP